MRSIQEDPDRQTPTQGRVRARKEEAGGEEAEDSQRVSCVVPSDGCTLLLLSLSPTLREVSDRMLMAPFLLLLNVLLDENSGGIVMKE